MAEQPLLSRIRANAARNSMDFSILPFHDEALGSILDLEIEAQSIPHMDFEKATRIDTHTHPIPQWFRALEPQAAGRETPTWNAAAHLDFMRSHEIGHSVLCVSTPQANAFNKDPGPLRKKKTIALARLLNEFVSKLCRLYPERFSFMAVLPLPHVEESLTELDYALGTLGAIGVGVLTNHEGMYPGDKKFKPIWQALQRRAEDAGAHEVVFIHPTEPTLLLEDGTLINSRPCAFFFISLLHHHLSTNASLSQHLFDPAWASSTLRPRAQYQASQQTEQFLTSQIYTGAYHMAQVLFPTSPSDFYWGFLTSRPRLAKCSKNAFGMTAQDLCGRIRSRA